MAQTLRITVKIDQIGSSVIDKIIEKVKKLNASLAEGTLTPFKASVEGLNQSLEKVSKTLEDIRSKITGTISAFRSQTKDLGEDTISRAAQSVGQGLETYIARITLITGGVFVLAKNIDKILLTGITGGKSLLPILEDVRVYLFDLGTIAKDVAVKNFDFLHLGILQLTRAFQGALEGGTSFSNVVRSLGAGLTSLGTGLISTSLTLTATRFFFREIDVFVGRILGRGQENLSVLTRATRLIGLFDDSLVRSFKTLGSITRLGIFGAVSAFINPILGLPGIFNSIVDLWSTAFRRLATRALAFFGDGRAQFTLIFHDLRDLARRLLPVLLRLAESFVFVLKRLKTEQLDAIFARMLGIEQRARGFFARVSEFGAEFGRIFLWPLRAIHAAILLPFKAMAVGLGALKAVGVGAWDAIKTVFSPEKRRKQTIFAGETVHNAELKAAEELKRKFAAVVTLLSSPEPVKKIAAQTAALRTESQAVEELKKKIAGLIEFQNIKQRIAAKQPQFVDKPGQRQRQFLQPFISSLLDKSLDKEFKPEHLNKVVRTLLKNLFDFKGEVQVPRGLANKISASLRQTLEIAAKAGLEPGKDAGATFLKSLTASFKPGASTELTSAVQRTLAGISQILQKSVSFRTAGTQISRQLAEGMNTGNAQVESAIKKVVKIIADPLPQSPALLGPLVFLPQMGFKIVEQLAQGMIGAFGFLQGIMGRLTALISDPLQRIRGIAQTAFLAERTGTSVQTISALSAAIEQVGGNAGDLNFALTRVNETLSRSADPETTNKFAQLGISIDTVKASAEPTMALFGEVAEVVKRFGINSNEARQALDLLGVTTSSSLVNLLMQGREGLEEMTGEISEFGGVIDQTTAQNAKAIFQIETKLRQFKDFLLNEVLAAFLPKIKAISETVFGFIKENATRIRAFLAFVADILKNLGSLLSGFISFAINNPRAALGAILSIVGSFMRLIGRQIATFFSAARESISIMLEAVFSFVFSFLSEIFPPLSHKIGLQIDVLLAFAEQKIFDFLPTLGDFLRRLPGLIADMLIFVGKVLLTFLGKIKGFIVDWFVRITDLTSALVQKLVVFLIQKVVDTIRGTEFESLLRFAGLGKFLDTANTIADHSTQVLAEIQKQEDQALQNLILTRRKIDEEAVGFSQTIVTADAKLETAIAALQKDPPLVAIFAQAAEKSSDELQKIAEAAKRLGENLARPELFEEFKANTAQAVSEVSEILKGLGLKEEFQAVLDSISPENFEAKLAEITAKIQEFKDRTQGILGNKAPSLPKGKEPAVADGGFWENLLNLKPTIDLTEVNAAGEEIDTLAKKLMVLGQAVSEVFGTLGQVFTDLFEISGKKAKEFAIAAKAVQLSQAIINVAVGVTQALGSLPPPLSFIQAAAVAAAGGIQIGKIISTGFAAGGLIAAGAGPKADDVPIRASRGEFVIPADAVKLYGVAFFESLRQKLVPKMPAIALAPNIPSPMFQQPIPKNTFANGGPVMGGGGKTEEKFNIVNIIDPSIVGQFLASQNGRRTLLNVLGDESREVKAILAT